MRPARQRRGAAAPLAAAVALALGATAAAAAPARRALSRSQASAVATAIALRQSDVPTLAQQPNPITAQDRKLDAQASACAGGVPPSTAYADTQSPAFVSTTLPTVAVASSVEILPSTALVASDFRAVESAKALPCLVSELDTQLRTSLPAGDTLGAGSARRLATVVSGLAQSFALRLSFPVRVSSGTSTTTTSLYFDEIGFGFGQAEVSFEVQSTGVAPSSALEHRLGGVLLSRARAALG